VAFADLDPSIRGNIYVLDDSQRFYNYNQTGYYGKRNATRTTYNHHTRSLQRRARRKNPRRGRSLQNTKQPVIPTDTRLYIVSWENVAFFSDASSYINAQVHFYFNGTIEMCWVVSNTNGNNIAAGLADPRSQTSIPASGGPFGSTGWTNDGEWPTDLCQRFSVGQRTTPGSPTVLSPSSVPSFKPTLPPSPAPLPRPCHPTAGSCVRTFDQFVDQGSRLGYGGTISVCGEIEMLYAIEITQASVTICCNETSRCTLKNSGGKRNLLVTGGNVTLRGLSFENGDASGGSGGNVAILSRGHHLISNCVFTDGFAGIHGGNLYVVNAFSITISRSIFESGSADVGGGGVAILNTPNVTVEGSYFEGNECAGEGGGLLVFSLDHGREVVYSTTIIDSFFESNFAVTGGGFATNGLGKTLNLTLADSYFGGNEVIDGGGAGSIFQNATLRTFVSGNRGDNNLDDSGICTAFFFLPNPSDTGDFLCFDISAEVLLPRR
jgi:hypothetical protein